MHILRAGARQTRGQTIESLGMAVALSAGVRSPGRSIRSRNGGGIMRTIPTSPWALLLAGGDGRRLKPLTRQIAGDPRPKQFCAILDGETLLDRTRRRAELLTRGDQHVVVVSREHEPYYTGLATQLAPDRLVVQPRNAGTAPGILYPLLRIR
ncbi:MAG: hypothetical protein DME13_19440, partial [Candidatus Rokuibacteriota bacterium]